MTPSLVELSRNAARERLIRRCKAALVGLAVGSLASCGVGNSAQFRDCEDALLKSLKSPASYKRIKVSEMTLDAGKPPHYYLVEITYDAANTYNALLRDEYRCSYRLDKGGRPTTEQFEPYADLSVDDLVVNDTTQIDTPMAGDDSVTSETPSDIADRLEAEALAADAELDAAGNALDAAGEAVENAADAIAANESGEDD